MKEAHPPLDVFIRARDATTSPPSLTSKLMLLLAAAACSSDAMTTAPQLELNATVAMPVTALAPATVPVAEAPDILDDALARLAPALGPRSKHLLDALVRLKGQRDDAAAWADVQNAVETLAARLDDEHRPDFDALLIELGIELPR